MAKKTDDKYKKRVLLAIVSVFIIVCLFNWLYRPYYFESNSEKLISMGIKYFYAKNYTDSTKVFEKIIKDDSSALMHYYLGYSLLLSGKLDEAYDYLDKSYGLNHRNNDINIALGDYYFLKGKIEKAEHHYKLALIYQEDAETYFKLGLLYYSSKDTANAYENLIKSQELDPGNIEIYPYLGDVFTKKGLFVSAFDSYEHYVNEKCKMGIPYSFLLTEEAESMKKKMRALRDLAGEL